MRWSPALLSVLSLVVAASAQAQPSPPPAAPPPAVPAPAPAPPAPAAAPAAQAAPPPATYSAELTQSPTAANASGSGGEQVGKPDAHVGLFVNALGVLQFGLSPTFEFGSNFSFNARVLFLNTGALSYVVANGDKLNFSAFAGPGLRYYFGRDGNLRGGYIGGVALYGKWEEQAGNSYKYDSSHLVVGAEGGYRWVFGNGFLLGVGAMAGYNIVTDKSATTIDPNLMPDTNDAASGFFGMLTLDIGALI